MNTKYVLKNVSNQLIGPIDFHSMQVHFSR